MAVLDGRVRPRRGREGGRHARLRRSGPPTSPRSPARRRCTRRIRASSSRRRIAGRPNPRHLEKAAYLELGRAAAVEVARRNGVGRRGHRASPSPTATRSRRSASASTVARELDAGGPRASTSPRDAEAELAPPAGTGPPPFATGGGYDGPLAYRQGEPMRPDVALAFDRLARGRARGRRRPHRLQRLPLRRRAGGPLRPQPGPEVGRAARARRCTATRPSSTSARRRPTAGSPRTRRASTSSCATRGNRGIGATPSTRARRSARRPTARSAAARSRSSSRPASRPRSTAPRSAGRSPPRSWPPSSTRSRASTRSRSARAGAQGIAQFMPGTARAYGPRRPVRRRPRRSTPRRT